MDSQPFLIFSLNHQRYGIHSLLVEEIFFLPEITPIAEVSREITGVLNLRGEIIPVIDLETKLGYSRQHYQIDDSVIILSVDRDRIGVIVRHVYDIKTIDSTQISTQSSHWRSQTDNTESLPYRSSILQGIIEIDDATIFLLNPAYLIQSAIELGDRDFVGKESENSVPLVPRIDFYQNIADRDRQLFQERAQHLKLPLTNTEIEGLIAIAIIRLDREVLAIDLEWVREFTPIDRITPIPCCPSHIIGNINLRGEIITLVHIGPILNLSKNSAINNAIVIIKDDLVLGLVVDAVLDIIYLSPSQIQPTPSAVDGARETYLQGTLFYDRQFIAILDLKTILNHPHLTIN
ncbi:chemotaxis protein CheW [Roseofilum casamattae]|uniref:Chemotaxis protein CheW n=1 Tax=Roseofilum casamattae BLCC-M143 TaxID=3022442 RepID=A0ABT7BU25_9CYAN|nr:chemotaxis protein CheW [Roseofilum casamattae]MDJ1181793.1 chemotaxis protein CheW [Roseofilum casamattae BLCC-M143]